MELRTGTLFSYDDFDEMVSNMTEADVQIWIRFHAY